MSFFPTPYPDELFYSILSRYSKQSGNNYLRHSLLDIYNCATRRSNPTLQLDVNNVIRHMEIPNMSGEDIIERYTLFPFYSLFLEEDRSNIILEAILVGKSRGVYNSLGITSSSILLNKSMRHCSFCIEEDLEKFGETYWHRLHQTPGVLFCPVHNSSLIEHKTRIGELSEKGFIDPNELKEYQSERKFDIELSQQLLFIAKEIKYLADNHNKIKLRKDENYRYKHLYRAQLRKKGIVSESGRLSQVKLMDVLKEKYAAEVLEALGFSAKDSFNWVTDILRRENRAFHPLKHLLLIHLIFGSLGEFIFQKTSYKHSDNTKKNYKTLHSKSSSENLLNKRNAFKLLIDQNSGLSITELRAMSPRLYMWLYRNDREWFKDYYMKNLHKKNESSRNDRVNWEERDIQLVVEINAILRKWNYFEESNGKTIRITRTSIALFSKQPYLVKKKLHKLPKTSNFINGAIETDVQYRIRRLSKAVSKLRLENRDLSKWAILKEAGIRKEYIGKEVELALQRFF